MTLDLEQSIRERAHAIWEREGRPEGRAVLHWDMARRELEPAGEAAPVQLFHPGRFFPQPVRIYLRDGAGMAQEVLYTEDVFDMPEDSPAHDLPHGLAAVLTPRLAAPRPGRAAGSKRL